MTVCWICSDDLAIRAFLKDFCSFNEIAAEICYNYNRNRAFFTLFGLRKEDLRLKKGNVKGKLLDFPLQICKMEFERRQQT